MRLLVDLMLSLPYKYSDWSEVTADKPVMLWDALTKTGTVHDKVYAIADRDVLSNHMRSLNTKPLAHPVRYYHNRGENDQTLTVVFHVFDGHPGFNELHVDVIAK